jgi:DNA (cytosine-5)-methyltransferase 1
MNNINPTFLVVDLFCGFGGTTLGFVKSGKAKVIACVNHDPKAIKSHWLNHPDVVHFEEDMRTLDLTKLIEHVKEMRALYPDAYLILWASLECTNFSKAKGGQPRNADSRTLADHLDRYVLAIDPDYIEIENVVEFMSWGPLDENGKPLSKKNGSDWLRWCGMINSLGFCDEWKELNSANFGAYTSRNRLFGIFAKNGLPIVWPEPTHSKNPDKQASLFGNLEKWKPVKEVLDFEDEGVSIFTRDKPLSDKTLDRIYAGLIKFVANGDEAFISKYYSGKPEGKNITLEGPAGTVTCVDGQSLVKVAFMVDTQWSTRNGTAAKSLETPCQTLLASAPPPYVVRPISLLKYNSTDRNGKHSPSGLETPCPTIATQNRLGVIQGKFILNYNHPGKAGNSVDEPSPVVNTQNRLGLIQGNFLSIGIIGKPIANNPNKR